MRVLAKVLTGTATTLTVVAALYSYAWPWYKARNLYPTVFNILKFEAAPGAPGSTQELLIWAIKMRNCTFDGGYLRLTDSKGVTHDVETNVFKHYLPPVRLDGLVFTFVVPEKAAPGVGTVDYRAEYSACADGPVVKPTIVKTTYTVLPRP